MKFDVEFRCKRCGLLTPAVVEVPDDFPPATKFWLCHRCHHCDARMYRVTTVGGLRAADPPAGGIRPNVLDPGRPGA